MHPSPVIPRVILRAFTVSLLVACLGPRAIAQTDSARTPQTATIEPPLVPARMPFPTLFSHRAVARPRVALVLSGGGARGVASIGVLQALEAHHIPVDLIVGTSMGSIIGGLYAAGYTTHELAQLVDTTDWTDILSLNDEARRRDLFLDQKLARDKSILVLRFNGLQPVIPQAFSTGQRLTNYLNVLTLQGIYHPDPRFDDLRIPFRAVATDLVSGKRVVIDHGDLAEALRASVAIPLLFSTVAKDTMQLLDGGLVDNMPVDVAQANGADIVIAVDVTSPLRPKEQLNAPWEIADQITTIMMQEANRISRGKADLVITPAIGEHLSSDFTDLDSMIARGRAATEAAINRLERIITEKTLALYGVHASGAYPHPHVRWSTVPSDPGLVARSARMADSAVVTGAMIARLLAQLHDEGELHRVTAALRMTGDSTDVLITGERYPVLRGVVVVGTKYIPRDTVLSRFHSVIGEAVNVRTFEKDLEDVLGLYRDEGYSMARIRGAEFDSTSGIATVTIDEGVIAKSEIQGTVKTRDWIIWRELPWKDGDVFNVSRVAQGIANLNGTNLFEQVLVSVRHDGAARDRTVTVITARERNTELIRFGLRTDSERNIQPSIDVRDENFLGVGAEIGLYAGGGSRNQSYIAEAKATRIFNSYLTFDLKGYSLIRDVNAFSDVPSNDPYHFDRERTGEYRETVKGGSFSFGSQLERLGSVTIAGRLENHEVFNIFNTPIVNQSYSISSVRIGTAVDTEDKYPFPTQGIGMQFFYESALVKFIEAVGFTKMYFSYDAYQPIARRHTIHPRFVLGVADESLPLTEQFSLGGQHSFYGLHEEEFRGRQLLQGSLEYQYELPIKIFFDTYLKLRYDIGAIWLKPDEIRLVDLRHGLGLTLGFDTPIGPAEFSVGRSFFLRSDLLNHPASLGPFVGYFSIGYPLPGI